MKCRSRSLINAFVLFLLSFSASGQVISDYYTSDPVTDTIPPALQESILKTLQKDQASIVETDLRLKKSLHQLFKDRADFVITTFNQDYFITESEITIYLQEILDSIYCANPSLPKETRIFAFRSDAVNAMTFGEGTIGFSLGLIARLEEEGQLAFVICHELAHHHLKHSDAKLKKLARLNTDRDLNRKVKAIARSDYNKYSKYSQLKLSLNADVSKYSREHEFQADSAGLNWFLNMKYSRISPVRLMDLLDKVDANKEFCQINYKKHFDFPEYPFKEKWMVQEKNNFVYVKNALPDSLRTHPACEKRSEVLKERLRISGLDQLQIEGNSRFQKIVKKSRYELAATLFHYELYGKSLYHFLMLAEEHPQDLYVNTMIATLLHKLYKAQRNHEGSVLELPGPEFPEEYNGFLNFVHALRTSELGVLGYWYAEKLNRQYNGSELTLYTSWMVSDTENTQLEREKYRKIYLEKYQNGKYRSVMEENKLHE